MVLRLVDLVSWITHQVDWITGFQFHWKQTVSDFGGENDKSDALPLRKLLPPPTLTSRAFEHNQNINLPIRNTFLNSRHIISHRCKILQSVSSEQCLYPPRGLDFDDVIGEKLSKFFRFF